jgi:hypothetical protein
VGLKRHESIKNAYGSTICAAFLCCTPTSSVDGIVFQTAGHDGISSIEREPQGSAQLGQQSFSLE